MARSGAMPTDLKLKNRIKILEILRNSSEITINDIMNKSGISRQTIVKSIDYYIEKGIILSLGKGSSSDVGGKRPELYKFNELYKYIICVRFENNTLIITLMNLKAEILLKKQKKHNENEELDIILNDFKKLYNDLIEKSEVKENDIFGIGICLSGISNQETGIMRYNSLYPSWGQNIPIVNKFKNLLPKHYEIIVANDAKMTGMAELFYNENLYNKRVVALYTYTGISYGYINKGKIELGSNTLIGEIGHMTVDPYDNEICQCGSKGCFEKMISEKRIREMLESNSEKLKKSLLGKKRDFNTKDLFIYSDMGDEYAKEAIDYITNFFSICLKNIILNIDPETIIIQGTYAEAGAYFKNKLKEHMQEFKYYPESTEFDIKYDNRKIYKLALIGTAITLIKKMFENEEMYKQ